MRKILSWELAGILVIGLAGSALHFVFEWAGHARPVALVAAVNESTWEHLKLAFWPGLVYALLEYPFLRNRTGNFWLAKSLGLWVMPLTIVALLCGYLVVLGEDFLLADILVFVLAVAAGQFASYRVLVAPTARPSARRFAVVSLLVLVAAFSLLTYYPPRFFLFEDPISGQYGIPLAH